MKLFSLLLLLFVLNGTMPLQAQETSDYAAVFHMNVPQGSEWGAMLRNVSNMQAALASEGGVQTEIVFHGPGLAMLLKSNTAQQAALQALAEGGVVMSACRNTMDGMGITADDLFSFAVEVDFGVAQLVRRQHQGWAYVKP